MNEIWVHCRTQSQLIFSMRLNKLLCRIKIASEALIRIFNQHERVSRSTLCSFNYTSLELSHAPQSAIIQFNLLSEKLNFTTFYASKNSTVLTTFSATTCCATKYYHQIDFFFSWCSYCRWCWCKNKHSFPPLKLQARGLTES